MMNLFKKVAQSGKAFCRDEGGNGSIELVMVFPAAMFFFTAAYETGQIGLKNVMLERAIDNTVRQVRIGEIIEPTHDGLKESICSFATIIPDCLNQITLEMERKDPRAWTPLEETAECVDRAASSEPVVNFTSGSNNDLMVLRVCALVDPLLPYSGVGMAVSQEGEDAALALVSTSSFVVEPYQ